MNYRAYWQRLKTTARALPLLAYAVFFIITIIPVLALAAQAIAFASSGQGTLLPSARQLWLLAKTIAYAMAVASLASAIGNIAGLASWFAPSAARARRLILFLALAAVPPQHHALAWLWLSQQIIGYAPAGWLMSGWVQTMAAAPLCFALTLVGAGFADQRLLEAARLLQPDVAVIRYILWPAVKPAAAAATLIVFLLTLADFSATSLFQVETYGLEVLAEFSASRQGGAAFWTSLPLLVVALVVTTCLGSLASAMSYAWYNRQPAIPWSLQISKWIKCAFVGAKMLIWLSPSVLVVSLTTQTLKSSRSWDGLATAQTEAVYTCGSCFWAAAICAPLALSLAWSKRQASSALWWAAILLPLALPPSLQGIALTSTWAKIFPPQWQGSDAMVALALASRFAPIAVVICMSQILRVDATLLDAAEILQPTPLAGWRQVRLPLLATGIFASAAAVFSLGLGDVAASLSVIPPGKSTLAIRIYNYLHYGASAEVAALCLATLGVAAGVIFFALRLLLAKPMPEGK